jgi:hypothetical protein
MQDFNVFTRHWFDPSTFYYVYKQILHSFKEPIVKVLPSLEKDLEALKRKVSGHILGMPRVARDTLLFILSFLS